MKKAIFTFLLSFLMISVFAQIESPVKWSYTAKKKGDKIYDIVITASLPQPWHIYSQTTPEGGPIPTSINFKTNPLLALEGKVKEAGSLKTEHDPNFGVDVKYFADKVDFVQTVKLKSNVKTNIAGTVEFMVCNDNKCLPPAKHNFNIALQ